MSIRGFFTAATLASTLGLSGCPATFPTQDGGDYRGYDRISRRHDVGSGGYSGGYYGGRSTGNPVSDACRGAVGGAAAGAGRGLRYNYRSAGGSGVGEAAAAGAIRGLVGGVLNAARGLANDTCTPDQPPVQEYR